MVLNYWRTATFWCRSPKLANFQNRPLLNSKPATEGQNRPVPDQPIGTDQESRTLPGLGRYRHGPLRPDFRYTPESKHCSDGSARRRRGFVLSTGSQLPRIDRDLDCGIRPKMVAVFNMMFRVPMPNPSPDLTDKVETALLSQVSEIADQVCDGMLVTGAAVPLKNRDSLGSPS